MKKLKLKHLAPYLPYELKCTNTKESYLQTGDERMGVLYQLSVEDGDDCVIMGKNGYFLVHYSDILAILRPLSDLIKEIEHNGEKFVPIDVLSEITTLEYHNDQLLAAVWNGEMQETEIKHLCYEQVALLFEWHFDVFGLIEKRLAIDVNELKNDKQ